MRRWWLSSSWQHLLMLSLIRTTTAYLFNLGFNGYIISWLNCHSCVYDYGHFFSNPISDFGLEKWYMVPDYACMHSGCTAVTKATFCVYSSRRLARLPWASYVRLFAICIENIVLSLLRRSRCFFVNVCMRKDDVTSSVSVSRGCSYAPF